MDKSTQNPFGNLVIWVILLPSKYISFPSDIHRCVWAPSLECCHIPGNIQRIILRYTIWKHLTEIPRRKFRETPSCLGSKMRLNDVARLNSAVKMGNTSAVTSERMQSKGTSEQAFWWQKCFGKASGDPKEHSLWREISWPVLEAVGLSFRDNAIWSVKFWFGDNFSGFCGDRYLLSPANLHFTGSPVPWWSS